MNEKEVYNLLNSIDDDLIDEKIDELMKDKNEDINTYNIKEKSMSKISNNKNKKLKFNKKAIIIAAIISTLSISTIYASDIAKILQSFFNKSTVYSTVVDGDAYYLPEKIKLNDDFTILNTLVSNGSLDMAILSSKDLTDSEIENLNICITPLSNENINYVVGGFMHDKNIITLLFMNGTEDNYNIVPFKDFKLEIDGNTYDISLEQASSLETDEHLAVGESKNNIDIVNIAGKKEDNNGLTNIQLVAGFNDTDLKLSSFEEVPLTEFTYYFENNSNGSVNSTTTFVDKEPIKAYNDKNDVYTLNKPSNAEARPVTMFETDAKIDENLTVKVPTIVANYEKEVANVNLTIPENGKVELNKELDFIIQKINIKSIERISQNSAIIEFELNTGDNKNISIIDIGEYCSDVINATTTINGNSAKTIITFDENIKDISFAFSWPFYQIQGDWVIELNNN